MTTNDNESQWRESWLIKLNNQWQCVIMKKANVSADYYCHIIPAMTSKTAND